MPRRFASCSTPTIVEPRVLARQIADLDAAADRALARPEPLRQRHRSPSRWWRRRPDRWPKRAAFDEPQADRLDIAGRHAMQERARTIGGVDRAHALGGIEDRALAAERHRRCERGLRDAGKSAQIFQQRQRRRARIVALRRLSGGGAACAPATTGSWTRMLSTPSDSKPGSNCASAAKLRPNSAAPTSSVTVTAIWPATITCSVRPLAPPRASIAPSRRSCASECLPHRAQRRQADHHRDQHAERQHEHQRAPVEAGRREAGSCTGLSASNASPAHIDSSMPAVPPSATTHALSDSIKRTSRRFIGADRPAQREFAAARFGARQQQAGHARAGDHQHERDGAEQQRDGRPDLCRTLRWQAATLRRRASRWCRDTPARAAARRW